MDRETLEMTAPPLPVDPPVELPTEETPEQIEARLHQRQQVLAGKLDVLEQQTLGSIRDTIGSVTDTVNTVQAVVSDPVAAVQSAVLNPIGDIADGVTSSVTDWIQNMNPTEVIRRHPFESVGVAVAGGVVVGMLLTARAPAASGAAPATGGPPTLFQSLTGGLRNELLALGRELFDTVSKSLVERVKTAVSTSLSPPTNNTSSIG